MSAYNSNALLTSTTLNPPTFVPNDYTIRGVPLDSSDVKSPIFVLLLGATGTGKSAFIEALVGDTSLGISGNSLALTTREVTSYSLENFRVDTTSQIGRNIVIVDTPGLNADIAEVEYTHFGILCKMIPEWMQANDVFEFTHILYFEQMSPYYPSGSQMNANTLFGAMLGDVKPPKLYIVSTLWDRGYSIETISRASRRHDGWVERWQTLLDTKCEVLKFMNTQESAMYILNRCLMEVDNEILSRKGTNPNKPWVQNLRFHLTERASTVEMSLGDTQDDIRTFGLEGRNNGILEMLANKSKGLEAAIKTIRQQLEELEPPANSTTLAEGPSNIESTIADDIQDDRPAKDSTAIAYTDSSHSAGVPRERQVESTGTSSARKTWRRYLGRF